MRAANLLPAGQRPRGQTGAPGTGAYVVVGVLGVVLLATVAYVLTLNQITSQKVEIARAQAETERVEAQARTLAAFGDFAQVKRTRTEAVKQLANGRFDWERLARELAHVLPPGVWVTSLTASAGGKEGQGGAGSTASSGAGGSGQPASGAGGTGTGSSSSGSGSSSSGAGTGGSPGSSTAGGGSGGGASGAGAGGPVSPTAMIAGCAPSQAEVATTLVRLRLLHGATDVRLLQSAQADSSGGGTSGPSVGGSAGGSAPAPPTTTGSAAPASGGGAGAAGDCQTGAGPGFSFQVVVSFASPDSVGGGAGRVPPALGGGA